MIEILSEVGSFLQSGVPSTPAEITNAALIVLAAIIAFFRKGRKRNAGSADEV